jgi:hypothetical protein
MKIKPDFYKWIRFMWLSQKCPDFGKIISGILDPKILTFCNSCGYELINMKDILILDKASFEKVES